MTRKIYLIAALLIFVAGVLITFLLLRRSERNYVNVLPEDARAVAEVDLTTLSEPGMTELIKSSLQCDTHMVERLGLSTERPAYLFATDEGRLGLVAAIQDMNLLNSELQAQGHAVESQRGLKWCHVDSWLVAFDRHRVLVMECDAVTNEVSLRKQMVEMMKSTKPASLLASLDSQAGNIRLAAQLDVSMLNIPNELVDKLLSLMLKEHPILQASVSLGEHAYSLSADLVQTPAEEGETGVRPSDVFHPIQGHLAETGPSCPLFWAGINISGEQLLQLMRKIPALRTMLISVNLFFDADMVIRSVNGDVSLAVTEGDDMQTQWLLTAQLSDTSFLRNVPSWERTLSLSSIFRFQVLQESDFLLVMPDNSSFYFGVRDDMLYVTPSATLALEACHQTVPADGFERNGANGRQFFVTADASRTLPILSSFLKTFARR